MRLYVPVDKDTLARLRETAERNHRRLQDEAAFILENALVNQESTEQTERTQRRRARIESDAAGNNVN